MTKLIVTNLQEKKAPEEPVSKSPIKKVVRPARPPFNQLTSVQRAKYFLLDQNAPSLRKINLNPERSATDCNLLTLSKVLPAKAREELPKRDPAASLPFQGVSGRREPARNSIYPSLDKKPTDPTNPSKGTNSAAFLPQRSLPVREDSRTAKTQEPDTAKKRITAELLSKRFSKQAFSFRLFESWKELT